MHMLTYVAASYKSMRLHAYMFACLCAYMLTRLHAYMHKACLRAWLHPSIKLKSARARFTAFAIHIDVRVLECEIC